MWGSPRCGVVRGAGVTGRVVPDGIVRGGVVRGGVVPSGVVPGVGGRIGVWLCTARGPPEGADAGGWGPMVRGPGAPMAG